MGISPPSPIPIRNAQYLSHGGAQNTETTPRKPQNHGECRTSFTCTAVGSFNGMPISSSSTVPLNALPFFSPPILPKVFLSPLDPDFPDPLCPEKPELAPFENLRLRKTDVVKVTMWVRRRGPMIGRQALTTPMAGSTALQMPRSVKSSGEKVVLVLGVEGIVCQQVDTAKTPERKEE